MSVGPSPFCHSPDRAKCTPTSGLEESTDERTRKCGDREERNEESADLHRIGPKLKNAD